MAQRLKSRKITLVFALGLALGTLGGAVVSSSDAPRRIAAAEATLEAAFASIAGTVERLEAERDHALAGQERALQACGIRLDYGSDGFVR